MYRSDSRHEMLVKRWPKAQLAIFFSTLNFSLQIFCIQFCITMHKYWPRKNIYINCTDSHCCREEHYRQMAANAIIEVPAQIRLRIRYQWYVKLEHFLFLKTCKSNCIRWSMRIINLLHSMRLRSIRTTKFNDLRTKINVFVFIFVKAIRMPSHKVLAFSPVCQILFPLLRKTQEYYMNTEPFWSWCGKWCHNALDDIPLGIVPVVLSPLRRFQYIASHSM